MDRKFDLIMWTYNSEKNLPAVLKRIQEVIPSEYINRKIITDDHSKDRTREISEKFGWEVHMNHGKGLNDNTRTAMELVTAPFFLSFEHDILLARNWWQVMSKYMDNPKVAVAQGVRVSTNPAFRVLDNLGNQRTDFPHETLDNNIGRTDIVKRLGYNEVATPPKLAAEGLQWVVDKNAVSDHIRPDSWDNIIHDYKMQIIFPITRKTKIAYFRVLLTSPIRSAQLAYKTRVPLLLVLYPIDRYGILLGALKSRKPLS